MRIAAYAKNLDTIGRGLESFSLKKRLLSEIRKRIKPGKIIELLEIGCGSGILLMQLRRQFPQLKLHGLNLSKHHGIRTRQDFKINAADKSIFLDSQKELPYIHFGDTTNLLFKDNKFDLVVSQVTFLHVKNKAKAIEEVYRVLKPEGIALISLGPYSLYRKQGHSMPPFFKNLNKKLGRDYNPRFLLQTKDRFLKFSNYLNRLKKEGYQIDLWQNQFTSKTQKARGCWLIMKKEKNRSLNLGLKYNKSLSQQINKKFAKRNPVNWGCIDVYSTK